MRYLVTARVKPGRRAALDRAIDDGSLGRGSIAGDEYQQNMAQARQRPDGRVQWVETCFCAVPLDEERPVLGGVFRSRAGEGRPRSPPLPPRERRRAVGVLGLRLHGKLEAWLARQGRPFRDPADCR